RLRLAAEPQTGRREVSALTDARKTLAYDFFRILRAPHVAHRCYCIHQKNDGFYHLVRCNLLKKLDS
ncbi:hypothetical protein, partial [Escherichia coli]|uniref:hypothetical protein n=1 Tax=Escherichia coli TaxID=562 RepID=UPI00301C43BB